MSVGEHAGVGTEVDKVTRGRDSIYDPFCTHPSSQCVYTGKSGRNGKFIVFSWTDLGVRLSGLNEG